MKLPGHESGHLPSHIPVRASRLRLAALTLAASAFLAHTAFAAAPAAPNTRAKATESKPDGTVPALAPASGNSTPAAPRTFHDRAYKVSFDYPGDWVFSRKDGAISTFRLDARSAPRKTTMRAVAAMPANPFPASTFAGAYVYLSVTPHTTDASCAKQASSAVQATPRTDQIAGLNFTHGHDEQHDICTIERDEIYTTYHNRSCYRFDLAINTFCGGAVSGVKDITPQELDQVRERLQAIVATVRFDHKK